MNAKTTEIRSRGEEVFSAAVAAAEELDDRLGAGDAGEGIDDRIDALTGLVEALPLDVDRRRICFLRNWTAGTRALAERGEQGAARYQVNQVRRLLEKLRRGDE